MAWVRYESEFTSHPKVQAIAPQQRAAAIAIHHAAVEYCAETLTDGFVPTPMLALFAAKTGVLRPKKPLESLLEVGLFVQGNEQEIAAYNARFSTRIPTTSRGVLVHDYLEYNPSSQQVKEDRARAADRQKRKRDRERQGQLDLRVTQEVTPERHTVTSQRDTPRDASRARVRGGAGARSHPTPDPKSGVVGVNGSGGGVASANAGDTQANRRPAIDIALDRVRNVGAELPLNDLTAELRDALDQRYDELTSDQLVELRDLHAALAGG